MNITKAVITAAGPDQRTLPLQTLVAHDGVSRSALELIAREAVDAGAEEIAVIVHAKDEDRYAEAAGDVADRIRFLIQPEPRGYGHALACAREFVGDDSFLHLVGDHLTVPASDTPCARQLVEVAKTEACSVSGVRASRESLLPYYGVVGGRPMAGRTDLYRVECVREMPAPTQAEQELAVPGLRAGFYLCFFGMHVLTPAIMELLDDEVSRARPGDSIPLSPSLDALCRREQFFALEIAGERYNIGRTYGTFYAQLALALQGEDREEILAQLIDMLASRHAAPT